MNLVGKIMVVLIFVMSMVFMAFSVAVYATHKNWREVIERTQAEVKAGEPLGLKYQIAATRELNEKLKTQLDELQKQFDAEMTAKRDVMAKLATAETEWSTKRTELETENAALKKQVAEELAKLAVAHDNLKNLTDEVGKLRDEIRVAQDERDQHFAKVIRLTDEIQQTQGSLKRLQERSDQLVSQVAQQKKVLTAYDLNEYTPVDKRPPQVHGKVLAVNQNDLAELSLGSDDGLRAGHTLEIFRASNYLGRVEVLTTSNDRAVGKILSSYKRGIVQKGDDVATRFKAN